MFEGNGKLNVFERPIHKLRWKQKADIDPVIIKDWNKEASQAQLSLGCSRLSGHVEEEKMRKIIEDNQVLIQTLEQAIYTEIPVSDWPHLFLVTDKQGVVLVMGGCTEVVENSRKIGIQAGTRFDMPNTGLNAITMSVKLQQPVFMRGNEHDLHLFKEWSSFCTPILTEGVALGYLNVSFPYKGSDPSMEIVLVELYLNVLKEGVFKKCPSRRRNALYEQFEAYGLTPREKQIAYYWALSRGGLQIAEMLGITESTVRSVLKIIYRKIGVSDKGQFMQLFL